jgi:hypothetical protein
VLTLVVLLVALPLIVHFTASLKVLFFILLLIVLLVFDFFMYPLFGGMLAVLADAAITGQIYTLLPSSSSDQCPPKALATMSIHRDSQRSRAPLGMLRRSR